jgi:hypothetical protein
MKFRLGTTYGAVVVALLWCLPTALGQSVTISVTPVADTFVTAGTSTNLSGSNFGGAGVLAIAGRNAPNDEFESILRFDLEAVQQAFDQQFGEGQWLISSAELQLTLAEPDNPIFSPNRRGQFSILWRPDVSWIEGTGTPQSPATDGLTLNTLEGLFAALPDEQLGRFPYDTTHSGEMTYQLSLEPGFIADVQDGAGLNLSLVPSESNTSLLFNSIDYTLLANRPLLTITAVVPEPGTMVLGALGALGVYLSFLRARKI